MKREMANIWTDLTGSLEIHSQRILKAIVVGFESALRIGMPEGATESGAARLPRSVVRTLFSILHHRKESAIYSTEDAIEEFRSHLFTLETNALAHVRTAFLGQYMEDAYHAANKEYG
jgi:hypothetical protein